MAGAAHGHVLDRLHRARDTGNIARLCLSKAQPPRGLKSIFARRAAAQHARHPTRDMGGFSELLSAPGVAKRYSSMAALRAARPHLSTFIVDMGAILGATLVIRSDAQWPREQLLRAVVERVFALLDRLSDGVHDVSRGVEVYLVYDGALFADAKRYPELPWSDAEVLARMKERHAWAVDIETVVRAARADLPDIHSVLAPSEADHQCVALHREMSTSSIIVGVDSDFCAIHGVDMLKLAPDGRGGLEVFSGHAAQQALTSFGLTGARKLYKSDAARVTALDRAVGPDGLLPLQARRAACAASGSDQTRAHPGIKVPGVGLRRAATAVTLAVAEHGFDVVSGWLWTDCIRDVLTRARNVGWTSLASHTASLAAMNKDSHRADVATAMQQMLDPFVWRRNRAGGGAGDVVAQSPAAALGLPEAPRGQLAPPP